MQKYRFPPTMIQWSDALGTKQKKEKDIELILFNRYLPNEVLLSLFPIHAVFSLILEQWNTFFLPKKQRAMASSESEKNRSNFLSEYRRTDSKDQFTYMLFAIFVDDDFQHAFESHVWCGD